RDVPGRPAIYATTKTFLDYFNLSSLDELPTLSEIKDLERVNEELDLDDEELIAPRSLEMRLEEGDDESSMNDAELDEVTNTVNSIQENIRNLFAEEEEADIDEEADEAEMRQAATGDPDPDQATPDDVIDGSGQADPVEPSEVNDDGKQ
ncbi:MAG: SMC-Scp complex subunit ScpB, partial [Pseudomonadales bacterium]